MAAVAAYKWARRQISMTVTVTVTVAVAASASAAKSYFIGTPQRASTARRSRIGGKTSLFQSAP